MKALRLRFALTLLLVVSVAGGCGRAPSNDPCAELDCGRGACESDGRVPRCECEPLFRAVGLSCVPVGCTPNPCTTPNQTQCVETGEATLCECDRGFLPTESGCTFDEACAAQHADGDEFEPDECPTMARQISTDGTPQLHSLSPDDVDWVEFQTEKGRVYAVEVHAFAIAASAGGIAAAAVEIRGEGRQVIATWRAEAMPEERSFLGDGRPVLVSVKRTTDSVPKVDYVVRVEGRDFDDFPGTLAEVGPLQTSYPVYGWLQYDGDVDVFAVSLEPKQVTEIVVDSLDLSLSVRFFDAAGNELSTASYSRTLVVRDPGGGPILVRVAGTRVTTPSSYSVSRRSYALDDVGDTVQTAAPFGSRATRSVHLQFPGDVDVFSFDVVPTSFYEVSADGCSVTLERPPGAPAVQNFGSLFKPQTAETLAVRVSGYAPTDCAVTIHVWPDDAGEALATARALSVGPARTRGEFEPPSGDTDAFSFSGEAAHVYRVRCWPVTAYSCSVQYVSVSGANRNVNDVSGVRATYLTPAQQGMVWFTVGSSGHGGTYDVMVEDLGVDESPDLSSAAVAVTVLPAQGSASFQMPLDADWFRFGMQAGGNYAFTYKGSLRAWSSLSTASGAAVSSSVVSAQGELRVYLRASMSDAALIRLASDETAMTGTYRWSIDDLGPDDAGDSITSAMPIVTSPSVASGRFEIPTDLDVFSFAAEAGHQYRFTCTRASKLGCSILVRDANGARVAPTTGSAINGLTFTSNVTETRYVSVLGGTQPDTYTYQLEDLGP